jgi:hypothetical protein
LFNFISATDILKIIKELPPKRENNTEDYKCDTNKEDMNEDSCNKRLRLNENEQIATSSSSSSSSSSNTAYTSSKPDFALPEKDFNEFSERLISKCLEKAARAKGNISASDLRKLAPGKARREMIDDITVITVDISLYTKNM